MTPKQLIVKHYLDKFGTEVATNTIARIIHNEHQEEFVNFEQARGAVRRMRGEDGRDDNIDRPEFHRTEEQRKAAIRHELPETDYEKNEEWKLPTIHKNVLLLSDIHLPYHEPKALELAIEYGVKHDVDAIYLNGDTLDMYQASRFTKDPRLRSLSGELEMCRDFLQYLKDKFNKPIFYKIGNHEERWENYLKLKAPEMFGIPEFKLDIILRFREYGCHLVKSKQMARFGKLAVMHGHEFGHSVFSPVNPARGLYLRAKESAIIGHHHQSSEHSEKQLDQSVTTCWSVGALCGLQPEYYPFNKWNHGFARIEIDKQGNYQVHNKRIIKGEIR